MIDTTIIHTYSEKVEIYYSINSCNGISIIKLLIEFLIFIKIQKKLNNNKNNNNNE